MVRGSDEDFRLIFGAMSGEEAFEHVKQSGCPMLIYTKNREGVELFTTSQRIQVPVNPIEPVSTIGAGDAFNAGIIYALADEAAVLPGKAFLADSLNPSDRAWEPVLRQGIRFSENVCLSLDNYISVEFGKSLNQLTRD